MGVPLAAAGTPHAGVLMAMLVVVGLEAEVLVSFLGPKRGSEEGEGGWCWVGGAMGWPCSSTLSLGEG